MMHEGGSSVEKLGEKLGYVTSYFLFTTILFLVLSLLNKVSGEMAYFFVMGITVLIAILGAFLKKVVA
tara:strand:- start:509 stop:712 length:204 start_codon:yes stop_codon:yes gene_type:complete